MSEQDLELAPDDSEAAESPSDDEEAESDLDDQDDGSGDPGANGEAAAADLEQVRTAEALEKLRKKLDTSANTWRKRVAELMGEDFDLLVVCELCGDDMPGYHWPADVMQPANDLQAHLLEVLRLPLAPEFQQAQDARVCSACTGFGKVRTGSKVPGKETITCSACRGFGYTPPPGGSAAPVVDMQTGEIRDQEERYEAPKEDADVWGSPRILADGMENPNYGKMPQYKDANLP